MYCHGWFQVAFERDITEDLTAASIGTKRLVLVRTAKGLRAYDADCPHRGAHLAYGGKLDDRVIVCPFHGYRVGLATESLHGFRVSEYPTFVVGGLVFVRLSDSHEHGFISYMEALATDHTFVPGFEMPVKATSSLVVENGFDNRHFSAVHGVQNDPKFAIHAGEHGELLINSVFDIPATQWRPTRPAGELVPVPYTASTFSPGIIIGCLGGDFPYSTITTATPTADDCSTLRFSLALPVRVFGPQPRPELCQQFLQYVRQGLEQDQVIWEHMSMTSPQKLTPADEGILTFQKFCLEFGEEAVA